MLGPKRLVGTASIRWIACALAAPSFFLPANAFEADVAPLVQKHCIACHTGTILAPLDLAGLGYDLSDPATFRGMGKGLRTPCETARCPRWAH